MGVGNFFGMLPENLNQSKLYGVEPVSYTHLEVTFAYANDSTPVVEVTFNLTNEKPEVPETPNTPDTPQSVSYTHLDVYKRQVYCRQSKDCLF